jgi:hypothetical protein
MSSPAWAAAPVVAVHWPLYSVFPACSVLFYAFYYVLDGLSRQRVSDYKRWSALNQKSWRQNVCCLVHTYGLVLLMAVVLGRSHTQLRSAGISPYYDPLAYCAVCFSLGYMTLTLPWSLRHWCGTELERAATRPSLMIHHGFVVIAHLVYVLTQTSPWPGALSIIMFEFSNLNLMPHHLMTQVRYHGKWHFLNGVCFFFTCTFVRIVGSTILGVYFIRDAAAFDPTLMYGVGGAWGARVSVVFSLVSFWIILLLSCYWYANDVLSEVHKEFSNAWGKGYWKVWRKCGPCCRPSERSVEGEKVASRTRAPNTSKQTSSTSRDQAPAASSQSSQSVSAV